MKHDPLKPKEPIYEALALLDRHYDPATARYDRDRPDQPYRYIPYDEGGLLHEGPWYPRYDAP